MPTDPPPPDEPPLSEPRPTDPWPAAGPARTVTREATAMHDALALAAQAAAGGEVPVGAVVLDDAGRVVATAANAMIRTRDPSAHAELVALRAAVAARGGTRLDGCTLVVTLEPCAMCAGACVHFRVGRIVFGAYDPKGGAVEHGPRLFHRADCLHRPEIVGGVREADAGALLRDFFAVRRTLRE